MGVVQVLTQLVYTVGISVPLGAVQAAVRYLRVTVYNITVATGNNINNLQASNLQSDNGRLPQQSAADRLRVCL